MAARREVLPIRRIPRHEFLHGYWSHAPGEHVTLVAPTGNGKTTLGMQLLSVTATEERPAVVFVVKPRDATAAKFGREHGYRRVSTWPPPRSIWRPRKPRGYLLWPRHNLYDPRGTLARHADIFGYCLADNLARGNRITFADDLYTLSRRMQLDEELISQWTLGRAMNSSLWGATQRPNHVPLWAYSQASHMFLSYDPDKRARDRYGEIGGMDPQLIESGVDQLDEFEWLYVRLQGRQSRIAVIGA